MARRCSSRCRRGASTCSRSCSLTPALRCAQRPSSAATRGVIGSPPKAPSPSAAEAPLLRSFVKCPCSSVRNRVPVCSRSRPMCRARARLRASRRSSSYPPTRRRSARARRRSPPTTRSARICTIIRTARQPSCAKRSGGRMASIPRASCAARAPTICSTCWRAPICRTATRRSTPRTASWSIRS